ncbi:MAG: F0F1 ATP synthase subunit delta [Micropruina sp.]|nr:MAG: F0F1 ATP synthase subunit delta [Micropruina sp.]
MNATTQARLNELDGVLDAQQPTADLAGELFAIVDVIERQPALRRALTDPSTAERGLSALVEALFGGKVSKAAQTVLIEAAKLRWGSTGGLADAIERQAVRALLSAAQETGRLDEVEDELFRFGRVVAGDPALRSALADRTTDLAARRQLVAELLAGKARPETVELAQRAVAARRRTYDLTVADYLKIAAALRARQIAHVVVARPLTAEQTDRLRAALSKQLGRDLTLQVTIDPNVLGGVRVSVGDEVIEGTVSKRLTDAERQIS